MSFAGTSSSDRAIDRGRSIMRDGLVRTHYPDGTVETEVCYDQGVVHGVTKHWHPNGSLAAEIPMDRGQVEGVARFWSERGDLLGSYEIRNGTGVQKAWHSNGV